MSDARRQQLLDNLFGQPPQPPVRSERLDPALVSKLISGLVFAQRPITEASQAITAEFNLGPRGAFMLSLINNGLRYPKDLSLVLRIGRSLITAELNRLAEAGLVESAPDQDRRRSKLTLTPLGQETSVRLRREINAAIERRLAGFSAEQIELFATMLVQLQQD